jgi:type VI secretion system ImpA family protein
MAAERPFDVSQFLAPISDDNPAGKYLRWENEYDALGTALDEETDAKSQGIYKRDVKKADWHAVINLGTALLRDKSKDLLVAAWVAEGLAQTRGPAGLRDGLLLVAALQDAFWATAHPESGDLELRMGVYEYLDDEKRFPLLLRKTIVTDVMGANRFPYLYHGESRRFEQEYARKQVSKKDDEEDAETYLAGYLAENKPRAETFDDAVEGTETAFYEALAASLNECKQALDQLNESIRQQGHYGAKGPTLFRTERTLEEVIKLVSRFLQQRNAGQPAELPEAATGTDESAAEGGEDEDETAVEAQATGAAQEPMARKRTAWRGTGGPISDPDDALRRIVEAAEFLRDSDPADPTPYLVVRALRAGELYRQPKPLTPANLPRPDGKDREELLLLATTSEAGLDLLAGAERALARPENGAWLDVYRYAITALAGLGYQDAERAALAQLHAILLDYPEWRTTELRDGTPSANSQTRSWLEERFPDALGRTRLAYAPPPATPDPESSRSGDGSNTAEPPRDPWDLALECVRNGQPHQAVALVARAVRDARSGRERFHRTLQQAELCLMLERPAIAAPLLDGLARQIDELHLDQWEEPTLCGKVLVAYYRCLQGQKDSRAEAVYRRLCQLDTALALTLDEAAGA